ncbi:MAG: GAF domain-containing protein [Anaerolineales bacterium]|jgi:GAF domain-containing protein/HAMP domain-containing protein
MYNLTIISTLHIFIAITQFALAGISFLVDRKTKINKSITAVLLFFGVLSFSIAFGMNSLTLKQSLFWMFIQSISIYDMGLILLLVTLLIFRPQIVKKRLVLWPIIALISLPILSLLADLSGASHYLFGRHLMISINEVSQLYTGGYLSIDEYVTGLLSSWFPIQIVGSYIITGIFPLLTTAIKERKSKQEKSKAAIVLLYETRKRDQDTASIGESEIDLENSKSAFVLLLTTVVIGSISMIFLDRLPPTIPSLIANISFTVGFAYILFKRSNVQFGSSGMARIVQDYPMFNKLLVTTLGIVLPAIFLVGFSSYSYYQQTLLNLYDDNLSNYATTEGNRINQEFESLIQLLTTLSDETQIQLVLTERVNQLQEMTQDEISLLLEEEAANWEDEQDEVETNMLKTYSIATIQTYLYNNPAFLSILISDQYGGLIVSTEKPEIYNQSQQPWWRWVRTTRQTYIGTPFWDEALEDNIVEIAIPIFSSPDNQTIIGIMYGQYILATIEDSLIYSSETQITNFELLDENYIPVNQQLTSPQENALTPLLLMAADVEKDWHVINYNGEDNIAVIEKIENNKANNNMVLYILALARVEDALASVFIARNGVFLLIAIMLFIAIGVTIVLANLITIPLIELTQTAERILRGEKDIQAEIFGSDEIGTLASTFNRMTLEMSNLVNGLESTVEERTSDLENRALQLETAALVARESAGIHDLQELLNQTVRLVSDRFGFYHTGIFLLDEPREYAVLQAANSEGGQKMLARGHKLQVGKVGVVGFTAGSGKPRIAQDVGADVIYYDNPDMPNTRSELALPLIVRGNVIGVLDVQSNQANAFRREDLEVLQVLADQIALAIDNTQLLQTSQRTLIELEHIYGQQISQAWKKQLSGRDLFYRYDPVGVDFYPRESERELISKQDDENGSKLSKEITFRGQVIGTIDLLKDPNEEQWSEDDHFFVEEILEQTAQALENARLLNQIRLRSDQIQLLQEITALSTSLIDEEELLNAVTQKLYEELELLECSIVLFDEERTYARLVTKATDSSPHPSVGSMLALEADNVSQEMREKNRTLIFYDVKNDPNSSTYTQAFSPSNTYTTVLLPLTSRGEVIGMINLEIDDPDREINEEDLNLFSQIHTQFSTALDSSRMFTAEQQSRQATTALLEISQIASSSLDINFILREVAQKSAAVIHAHRCMVSLINNDDNTIKVVMSMLADPQLHDDEMWERINTMEAERIENFPIYQQIHNDRSFALLDISEQPDMMPQEWTEPFGIKKFLMLPLISQDEVFGIITFDHINEEATFTPDQIDFALTISGQIASTIENARLFDQTVRRAERERLVAEITTKIRASNDPKTIINTAVNELRQALNKPEVQIAMHPDGEKEGENHRNDLNKNDE